MFAIAACAVNLMVHSAMPAMARRSGVTKQKARTEPVKESVENAASMMDMVSNETGASFASFQLATRVHGNPTKILFHHTTKHSHSETCGGVVFSEDYTPYAVGCTSGRYAGNYFKVQCNATHINKDWYSEKTCTRGELGTSSTPMGCVIPDAASSKPYSDRNECDVTPPVVVKYSYYDNSQCAGVPSRVEVAGTSSLGCGVLSTSGYDPEYSGGSLKKVYTMDGTKLSVRTYAKTDFRCTGLSGVLLLDEPTNACVLYGQDMLKIEVILADGVLSDAQKNAASGFGTTLLVYTVLACGWLRAA